MATKTRSMQEPTEDQFVNTSQVICTVQEGTADCGPGLGYQWGLVFMETGDRASVIGAFLSYVPRQPLLGQQKYLLLRLADGSLAMGNRHWDRECACSRLVRLDTMPELDLDRIAEMCS